MAKKKVRDPAEIAAAEAAISSVARQVKFTVSEYPISIYVSRFEDDVTGRFFVPEYQRNLAWHPGQQSSFIESLLVGLPIPFLFFYQTPDGRMEIVDGSQRMRAMRAFLKEDLRLSDLVLLPELNGFTFSELPTDRQNKLEDVTVRTIVLDTSTDPSTRAEMFARINKSGTTANEAEIRRGSLPGPVTELIRELAESEELAAATPMSQKVVDQREREELTTRFFAYLDGWETEEGRFPGYRDRPKKYLYDYLRKANAAAADDAAVVDAMRAEFLRMLEFVAGHFPHGFRKNATANSVPRVRFEAIAIGSALALRQQEDLAVRQDEIAARMEAQSFDQVVVSGSANVRSKLEGRIEIVRSILLDAA
ncbi:DUF262 domain-containing protein [Brevundimonas vesicularis]|uniref:DUF262 domain-containing protein n=1 Tax=Brevundimonas vesicularis TaxID=41276 RepID=UPI0022EC898D|nr:DUF262 domain-containing protein [Brevundimonas vesicularis]WBT04805.1 DUF262 domain-containing protein [Brevundimonas vesicularis]WBT04889.1 DUF262 domain-containing protein [Brevundimonas vesicularis]